MPSTGSPTRQKAATSRPAASPDAITGNDDGASIEPAQDAGCPTPAVDPVTVGLNLPRAVPVLWVDLGNVAPSSIQKDVTVRGRLRAPPWDYDLAFGSAPYFTSARKRLYSASSSSALASWDRISRR